MEEFPRRASPVYHFRRTATHDVELVGRHIKEGDKAVMWFASGNRDEEVFGNPDPPSGGHRAGRGRRPGPLQLRQRHQEAAGGGDFGLT